MSIAAEEHFAVIPLQFILYAPTLATIVRKIIAGLRYSSQTLCFNGIMRRTSSKNWERLQFRTMEKLETTTQEKEKTKGVS